MTRAPRSPTRAHLRSARAPRRRQGSTGILTEEMQRVVQEQQLGFVATVTPEGGPNLSPKGTTTVWDANHLVFADLASPGTVGNLRANPAVEVNVVDPFRRKGFRFRGTARVVDRGEELDRARGFFRRRGVRDATGRIRSVVFIRVEWASPLVSPAYDGGATEDEVLRVWRRRYEKLARSRSVERFRIE